MASVFPRLPKALMPIGGVPLIGLQLSKLRLNGCTQAVVVGGYGIHHVRNALSAFSSPSEVVLLEEAAGTLPAVLAGLGAVVSPLDPVVVLNADTIVDVDIALCVAAVPAWGGRHSRLDGAVDRPERQIGGPCANWSRPCLRGDRLLGRQPSSRTFRIRRVSFVRRKLRAPEQLRRLRR
jgi:hypothetical protein